MSIFSYIRKQFRKLFESRSYQDITPDEIFPDAHNRPGFNRYQLEGRLESRIQKYTIYVLAGIITLIFIGFLFQIGLLQISHGSAYAKKSKQNTLDHQPIIAPRGQIVDTHGTRIGWNTDVEGQPYPKRVYATTTGLSHISGYVTPPQKDESGNYYTRTFDGRGGVEAAFDTYLQGENGRMIIERNALGEHIAANTIKHPEPGNNLQLSIDADLQSQLYSIIASTAEKYDYRGGAGVLMNIDTGHLRGLVSYPEYSSQKLTSGRDAAYIEAILNSSSTPFLNRATEGLYTPGSIVKPFVGVTALDTQIITPKEELLSTEEMRVQNPYDSDSVSIFTDWKAHGLVDMREALGVSSNVYFYKIAGGYKDQDGVGIDAIAEYMKAFELHGPTGAIGLVENNGIIPNPDWKKRNFNGTPWRLGDTYNTAIGQYGFQITPLAAARSIAGIASAGELPTPTIVQNRHKQAKEVPLDISPDAYDVIQDGMRRAVTDGTADGLDVPYADIAAKTGTAEVARKDQINSWIIGFYPYSDPKYAFSVVMEHGPKDNTVGGLYVMRQLLDWMHQADSAYLPDNS